MRVLAAIIVAVCAFAVSGCSRWCSCPGPQQYAEGAYAPVPPSNSYGHLGSRHQTHMT